MNTDNEPEFLERRILGDNKFMQFVEQDILTPQTNTSYTYYQVESKWRAVLIIPVLSTGTFIVERIYRPPAKQWFLEFPAGGVEKGEDPLYSAQRELLEETGYVAEQWTSLGVYAPLPGIVKMPLHVFLAEEIMQQQEPELEEMELLEVEEHSLDDLEAHCRSELASGFLSIGLQAWYAHQRKQ